MTTIPTIETERLLLRGPRAEDFEGLAAFYASEQADGVGGQASGVDAWNKLASLIGHWALRGFGRWIVVSKETGRYVGHVGLLEPEGWPETELAWSVVAEAQGRGIAFEAAGAARRYAYDQLKRSTLISLVAYDNARSQALAERMGARHDGDWTHPDGIVLRKFRHPSPAALAAGAAA